MPKKLRVKDIKRDEVGEAMVEATGAAYSFAAEHRRALLYAAVGLAVVAVVVGGAVSYTQRREVRAAGLYGAAEDQRAKADAPPPAPDAPKPAEPAPSWSDVATSFRKVSADYPRTHAGVLAVYQAAIADIRAGSVQPAADALDTFVKEHPKEWAAPHALAALAAAREQLGDAKAAEAALERLRDGDWRSYPPGAALMLLAQLYERQSQPDKAKDVYKTLSEDAKYADTPYASQAKAKLSATSAESS